MHIEAAKIRKNAAVHAHMDKKEAWTDRHSLTFFRTSNRSHKVVPHDTTLGGTCFARFPKFDHWQFPSLITGKGDPTVYLHFGFLSHHLGLHFNLTT